MPFYIWTHNGEKIDPWIIQRHQGSEPRLYANNAGGNKVLTDRLRLPVQILAQAERNATLFAGQWDDPFEDVRSGERLATWQEIAQAHVDHHFGQGPAPSG